MDTKSRTLCLLKILWQNTDEEHPLSTNQLIEKLNEEYGISTYRTTLAKDIVVLQEFGVDIVTIHTTQSKYFVASRIFELPELKLLIDAVESSKFITIKKSEALIEKIRSLTSKGQVEKLKRNNYVVNRIKPDNERIYYIVDTINDAINENRQIAFQYYEYTGLKKKRLRNDGEPVTVDLRCDNSLMKMMIDRFRMDVLLWPNINNSKIIQTRGGCCNEKENGTFAGHALGVIQSVSLLK